MLLPAITQAIGMPDKGVETQVLSEPQLFI
jgi:hypothetical protein